MMKMDIEHPGDRIVCEHLLPQSRTIQWLAMQTGLAAEYWTDVCAGIAPLTGEACIALSRVFDQSAAYWESLQHTYDLTVERASDDT